jgi:hypothetical protein
LGGAFAQLAYIEKILIDQTFDVEKSKQVGDDASRQLPLVHLVCDFLYLEGFAICRLEM